MLRFIVQFRQDFSKYKRKYQIKYVEILFDASSALMGNVFKFSHPPGNYRKRELQPALELLVKGGLVHKVIHSAGQGIPLGAQARPDILKLIFVDIALAQSILGLKTSSWLLEPETTFANKGAISEAFVGQEILAYSPHDQKPQLYFWQRQQRGSQAEVDYLLQKDQTVIPIEVKSAAPGRLKSLQRFLDEHRKSPCGIHFSAMDDSTARGLRSLPLYAVSRMLGLSREQVLTLL